MSIQVNLLPGGYVKQQRHHRRFQAAVFVGCALLLVELMAGIVVHGRAERARELYAAADLARLNIASTKKELEEPRHEAEHLARQVQLAERLRTKHRWSRLLGTLSQITPSRVLITTIRTDPPQWPANFMNNIASAGDTGGANGKPARNVLRGVMLTGQAVDHQDLTMFLAALHGSNAFASLDLKQARREKLAEREAINFELECRW